MSMQLTMKIASLAAIAALFAVLVLPLTVSAQFAPPEVEDTGLPEDSNVNELLLRIINILLAIVGLVAVLFLIIGGFRYITAGGNEETAEAGKKTIINAIIGIVIVILSFVIVRVVSSAFLGL
jgi:hypothetical protein